ncbi:MAG: hypothetical protein IJ366_03045 [Clostridia bacterium]|nr:hypothetical protein [Clostridia bacterium]
MLDAIRRFMIGRYGFDKLGQALAVSSAVIMVLAGIIGSGILTILAYIMLIWCVFRVLSKNTVMRLRENRKYMELQNKVTAFFKRDGKYYRYFRCPKCRGELKVPKHKGKLAITCPHCRYEFIKKT